MASVTYHNRPQVRNPCTVRTGSGGMYTSVHWEWQYVHTSVPRLTVSDDEKNRSGAM